MKPTHSFFLKLSGNFDASSATTLPLTLLGEDAALVSERALIQLSKGTRLTISVEMRAANHGSRWRPICRWQEGESIAAVVDRAAALMRAIPQEPTRD